MTFEVDVPFCPVSSLALPVPVLYHRYMDGDGT